MITRIAFRVFLVCLVVCAAMALGIIWLEDSIEAPLYFQTAATLFIIGFGSFLIWFSATLTSIHGLLRKREL